MFRVNTGVNHGPIGFEAGWTGPTWLAGTWVLIPVVWSVGRGVAFCWTMETRDDAVVRRMKVLAALVAEQRARCDELRASSENLRAVVAQLTARGKARALKEWYAGVQREAARVASRRKG